VLMLFSSHATSATHDAFAEKPNHQFLKRECHRSCLPLGSVAFKAPSENDTSAP
jgi:hypothetical protein